MLNNNNNNNTAAGGIGGVSGKHWIPPHVHRALIEQLELAMYNPELFSEEAGIPPRKTYFISGRPGLRKAEAIAYLVTAFKQQTANDTRNFTGRIFVIPENPEAQLEKLELIIDTLKNTCVPVADATATTGTVFLLDQGHHLPLSSDPRVRHGFNHVLPALLKASHALLIVCCDSTMAQIPRETQLAYQYERQLFFPAPDDGWRKDHFRYRFTIYEAFVMQRCGNKLHVVFDKENFEALLCYLVDCSGSATIQEMDDFCAALFGSVHRIAPPIGGETQERHLDGTGRFRVLNWERCKDFLVDRGGCYCISRVDGEAVEQEYSLAVAGNRGLPSSATDRDRLPETMTPAVSGGPAASQGGNKNKVAPAAQGGNNTPAHGGNNVAAKGISLSGPGMTEGGGLGLMLKMDSERIRFDKDGREVPFDSNGPIEIPNDEEPISKKLRK